MSNYKNLADLVKVCSVLPIFAVMPAMAEVVEYTGSATDPVNYVTNQRIDEMGRDSDPKGLLRVLNMTEGAFSHDTDTNALIVKPSANGKITAQNLFVGIQSKTDADVVPSILVQGDKNTVLTLSSDKSGVYPLLSRFAELNIGTEANPLGEVNLIHSGAAEEGNTAIYVTGGNDNLHADSQELNIYANKVSIKSNATAITGNEGRLDLVANDTLDIVGDIHGYNNVYGGKSNLIFNINQNEGNTAKTTIVGNINAAKGSEVNIGLNGTDSSITGDLLVSAEGTKLPGGSINLTFGKEGKIAGNITAQDQGAVNITAGDDFDIKGKVFATTAGSSIDIQGSDIEIESKTDGVLASNLATINIGTEDVKEIEISAVEGRGARADKGASLTIGHADAESVEISAGDNYAVMSLYAGSLVDIKGQKISIDNNANNVGAVHAGNNVLAENHNYADSATLNITGDNVVITNAADDGIAVSAMSQGVVNIQGNATIKATNAVLARGESQVNINKSGEGVVKMLGDINFNYDKKTSGSKVDAFVDVTLAGADSFWTGNTVATYGTGRAPDASYLEVSSSKLTLKDGATWNATAIVDKGDDTSGTMYAALNDLVIDNGIVNIADTKRGIYVDRIVANDATFTGGLLNVNESIDIDSGVTTFGGNVLGNGVLTLASGATMDIGTSTIQLDTMNIDGTVIASITSGRPYGRLYGTVNAGENALLKLNVGSVGTYKIFNKDVDITVNAGDVYIVENNGADGIVITTKAVEDIAADTGLTTQAAGLISGLANSTNKNVQKISLAAQQILNSGDVETVEKEVAKANPDGKPVVQSVATSVQNQVLAVAAGRMSGTAPVVGRSGGDEAKSNGFWAQGLFNKSKYADQFHGYTRGFALGADTMINSAFKVGAGFAYNNSDIHTVGRGHTDIDANTLFVYGQYKPTNWFVNGTLAYTMAEYTEDTKMFGNSLVATYDVDSYGAQIMTGYDFASGITTEVGARYLHIAQDSYSNGLTSVDSMDSDFLTGVAGMKYAFTIENDWAVKLRPELRAAVTYDFVADGDEAVVTMPGVASYKVAGERLKRLGGEFGIGLTALYNGMEITAMYDLDLHEDYTSHTGMIKFRGRF